MRNLTSKQKSRAAECLGMAYAHQGVAEKLIQSGENAAAVGRLYYACFFAAQTACLERCRGSKKHQYWVGKFNQFFGRGGDWVPRRYANLLNRLQEARESADYDGTLPNDACLAKKWAHQVSLLLKKVRANTPLLHYPEFIEDLLWDLPDCLALEFDFYCPKSYIHKERVQFQCMAEKFGYRSVKELERAGRDAVKYIGANRQNDYVIGWNNRLGQSADGYLLFLDIDEEDEGKVKNALKHRRGWLFKTGNGFHFVGYNMYSSYRRWKQRFMEAADSKALGDIVDQRHVDFSLRRGYSTLRIGKSENKNFVPFMCWNNAD